MQIRFRQADYNMSNTHLYKYHRTKRHSIDIEREALTSMTDYLNADRLNTAPQLNGAKKRAKFAGIPLPDFSEQGGRAANKA